MVKDMAEGNSTSSQSVDFSCPKEPALADFSTLQNQDLGLTLSPRFQLREDIPQNLEQSFHENGLFDNAGAHGGQCGEVDLQFGVNELDTERDIVDSYNSLFSTLPELALISRKRTAEDPQESAPEKRQHIEHETPSLTTDSTCATPSFFDTFDSLFGNGADLPMILPDDPLPELDVSPQPSLPPETSESTKEKFALDEQDIISSTARGIFQVKQSEYVSPYPVPGGLLGYLPSAPGIHAKCVAAQPAMESEQISMLQAEVAKLTRQRDQYRTLLTEFTTSADTEKSPVRLLLEEKAQLQRVSTMHKSRADKFKKDAQGWEREHYIVSSLYNNLLWDVHTLKKLPDSVALPAGYKPTPLTTGVKERLFRITNNIPSASPLPLPTPGSVTSNNQPLGPPAQPKAAITIDLTDDMEVTGGPLTPPTEPERPTTLGELRNKEYGWLNAGKDGSTTNQAIDIDDDELARMMEEELARA